MPLLLTCRICVQAQACVGAVFPMTKTDALSHLPADLDKLEAELDPEMQFRPLLPRVAWLVAVLLFVLSSFHYYTAGFGLLPETTHRGIHIAFVLALIFLVFAARRSTNQQAPKAGLLAPLGVGLVDWALAIGAVVSSLYVPWVFHDLQFRVGNPDPLDWIMGTIMIVVVLEATRRSVGAALPIIAIVLMVYALLGPSLPGILAHPGNTWKSVVNHLYLTSNGIYGIALGVVATYVFHYVLFGVLATRVGLGRFFIDIATALAGRFAGGPAKVSIFASGLFGMISGSSIANTVTVGSLTIPMMIRIGYPRHFAGAVESTAATGGQITPPIMGAAAFLMVEYLALPYQTIIIAAIVPAFLHFFGVFCQVHFEAKKLGMRGMTADELPKIGEVVRRDWPTSVPLIVLLLVLFSGFTPYLAAFWGITACIVLGLTNRNPLIAVAFLVALVAAVYSGQIIEWPGLLAIMAAQPRRVRLLCAARCRRSRASGRHRRRLRDGRQVRHQRRRGSCHGRHHRRRSHVDRHRLQAVGHHHQHGRRSGRLLLHVPAGLPVRPQGNDAVLHAGDDRHRVHPARLRRAHHADLHHHGDNRCTRAGHDGRGAAGGALLRLLLRRAGGHHSTRCACRLCRRQHGRCRSLQDRQYGLPARSRQGAGAVRIRLFAGDAIGHKGVHVG